MPIELATVPCLVGTMDNYAFLLHATETGQTVLVDAPEAGPILRELDKRGWHLTDILITHHHDDHVQAIPAILDALPHGPDIAVHGAARDAERLPPLDHAHAPGDAFDLLGERVSVFDVSGHTINHIAFHLPQAKLAFTGDSLMAMGCGRVFEGTPAQMWESLKTLRALPDDTTICSGHEYTIGNMAFALTLEPDNPALISRQEQVEAARANGEPTVPSSLALERETNPFLRADDPRLQAAIGMDDADPVEVFAAIRKRKDQF